MRLGKTVRNLIRGSVRDYVCAALYSLGLSAALIIGRSMERVEYVDFGSVGMWLGILALAVVFTPITVMLFKLLEKFATKMRSESDDEKPALGSRGGSSTTGSDESRGDRTGSESGSDSADVKAKNTFGFLRVWAIIFVLWIPTFLALYPGAFVYDAQDEYIEVISRAFTMHHPLLHVLLLGGIIHAAEYVGLHANVGIAVYVLLQMTAMSAILSYSVITLRKWGARKGYCFALMLVYGLFPIFPMYAVCTSKDGMFSAFFLVVGLQLITYLRDREEFFSARGMIFFVGSSTLMMLLRNNGMYAYVVAIVMILILERKKIMGDGGRLIILMILSVILFFGCNFCLKTVTHATDDEHQEMLTVPIQQLARVYALDEQEYTAEQKATLTRYIPEEYLDTYNTRCSDIVKSGFDNEAYEADSTGFITLWLTKGIENPLKYVNAWLGTSYGYYYPYALNNVYKGNEMFTFTYTESSYFGFETEPPGYRDSKFPLYERFYRALSLSRFQQRVPFIRLLFSPGFMWWVFALVIMNVLRRRNSEDRRLLIALVPTLLLWLTVLLGPTTLVRYVLILWLYIPVALVMSVIPKKEEIK